MYWCQGQHHYYLVLYNSTFIQGFLFLLSKFVMVQFVCIRYHILHILHLSLYIQYPDLFIQYPD